MQTNYADAIINIAITPGNMVRIELGIVTPIATGEGKQGISLTPTQNVVMSIDGFVRSFGVQEQVMQKLLADGLIKRREDDQQVANVALKETE